LDARLPLGLDLLARIFDLDRLFCDGGCRSEDDDGRNGQTKAPKTHGPTSLVKWFAEEI
jgi:hypothetical protein